METEKNMLTDLSKLEFEEARNGRKSMKKIEGWDMPNGWTNERYPPSQSII